MLQAAARKFEFTGEAITFENRTLRRIRAVRAIPQRSIEPGDLGGWLQHEEGLDHLGAAWVDGEAKVLDAARVTMGGFITGSVIMRDNALNAGADVSGRVILKDKVIIGGGAKIAGDMELGGTTSFRGAFAFAGNMQIDGQGHFRTTENGQYDAILQAERLWQENAVLRARLAGYDGLQVVTEFSVEHSREWGPREGAAVPVPVLTRTTLARLLDELQDLRAQVAGMGGRPVATDRDRPGYKPNSAPMG